MIVVIPVYKKPSALLPYEIVSLKNTIAKFEQKYPICLVGPEGLNLEDYNLYFRFDCKSFPSHYFINIHTYNHLLKTSQFYEQFDQYSHMLLVQTDVYVFNTEIKKYYQYDYIGAPWHFNILQPEQTGLYGGNGGFSLRNIKACLEVLNTDKKIFSYNALKPLTFQSEFHTHATMVKKWYDFLTYYFTQNRFISGKNRLPFIYEDVFWSLLVPQHFVDFKVAPGSVALQFSFETKPELCYELNGNKLPLGCHGFHKYNPDFWRQFIPF
jgi:hypothetical protein